MSKFTNNLIMGIDVGYGDVKVVIGTTNEITHQFKFSSAIARAHKASSIRDTRIHEVKIGDDVANVYVGPDALNLPSSSIIDISNYDLLEDYAPAFIAKALQVAGIESTQISVLVCGLSVSQLNMSGYFKERISQFTVDQRGYKFDTVFLLPQGAGSKLAFDKYGDHFPEAITENPSRTFVGCDMGFNTLDLFYVTEGKTSPNLFEGIEQAGVTKIAKDLANLVSEKFQKSITIREAKEILDSGVYKLRGTRYDMKDEIKEVCTHYSKEILQLIEEKYGDIIDKCDFVCLLGGGAKIVNIEDDFFKVVKNKSEFYNAIGFYLFGTKQLKEV